MSQLLKIPSINLARGGGGACSLVDRPAGMELAGGGRRGFPMRAADLGAADLAWLDVNTVAFDLEQSILNRSSADPEVFRSSTNRSTESGWETTRDPGKAKSKTSAKNSY